MAKRPAKSSIAQSLPIGERLRIQRVDVLDKSIRDIAKLLDTAPIHVSDIETGKRSPSEELLLKMAKVYGLPVAELRAGFSKPDSVVVEVASESTTAAEKVPEFLRTARGWNATQWDQIIKQAKKIDDESTGKKGSPE